MSIGLFSIARSALLTHQRVLEVVSQNIANAETPGYSRQEAIVTASAPALMPYGMMGTGVQADNIIRKRDLLLDEQFRNVSGNAGSTDMRRDTLAGIQAVFGEPSDAGMSNALDQFYNSWSDLASTPSSQSARAVVQLRGQHVAQMFNDFDSGLSLQRSSHLDRLSNTVAEVNSLALRVAALNGQITSSEIGGHQAPDLRDQRDGMLDQLATKAGTRVVPQANGSITVLIGNSTLVDGVTALPLTLDIVIPNPAPTVPTPDLPVRIRLGNSVDRLAPLGGQLRAMTDTINTDIPNLRSRLDTMASALVSTVNAAHTQGFVFNNNATPGTAAGNFFDPGTVSAPVTAASIQLSAAVANDINQIAASKDTLAPLDNQIANQMAQLRNNNTTVTYTGASGTETGGFLSFFRSTVTRLGLDVRSASDDATVSDTLVDQANQRRLSVSGVNSDEELIQMVRVQQAYVAATKLIKTADEMLQAILAMV